MPWSEHSSAMVPVRMARVAIVAPQRALRETLVRLADAGCVDIDRIDDAAIARAVPAEPDHRRRRTARSRCQQGCRRRDVNGIAQEQAWYLRPDGSLDLAALLDAFEAWFRENADAWIARFDYREAGPHLLLMAFLQRVVNGGGRIHREYALGRRRVDLRVDWPVPVPRTTVIELKVIHRDPERTLAEGLAQTAGYMALCAADEGHLLLFDRTPDKRWAGRVARHQASHDGQLIQVWGL